MRRYQSITCWVEDEGLELKRIYVFICGAARLRWAFCAGVWGGGALVVEGVVEGA